MQAGKSFLSMAAIEAVDRARWPAIEAVDRASMAPSKPVNPAGD